MTGADSPVIADSSTDAMPSMTVPSPGITSPASTTTTSPLTSSEAGLVVPSRSVATRLGAHRAQRVGLRLAAALGDRLGEVGEHDREPQPEHDREREPRRIAAAARRVAAERLHDPDQRRQDRAHLDHEHDRVARDLARIELPEGGDDRPLEDVALEQGALWAIRHRPEASWSRARLASRTLIDFGPPSPNSGRLAWSSTICMTRSSGRPRSLRDAVGLDAGVGLGDLRVDARGRGRHRVGRDLRGREVRRVGALALEVVVDEALELVGEVLLVRAPGC